MGAVFERDSTKTTDFLALDQAAFRKSPMTRAMLPGLKRNAAAVLANHAIR